MGNFIPKPYSTEQVSIRVDTELLAQVEAAANKYNMSRNAHNKKLLFDDAQKHLLDEIRQAKQES